MSRKLSYSDRQLLQMLGNNVDSFERSNADTPPNLPMMAVGAQKSLGQLMSQNPPFDAQFDIQILTKYFTVAAGAYTLIAAAALNAALKTRLAAFVFGNSDYASGFSLMRSQFPLTGGWAYENPFTFGNGFPNTSFGDLDATAKAQLQIGDVVLPITATVGGVNYVALVILRMSNGAYATLLDAVNSDMFKLNLIRYFQDDTSAAGLAQYANAIKWYKLSLFGKFDQDSITPNSQKQMYQQQAGIIDVPFLKTINKETVFAMYVNYDAVSLLWSVFVLNFQKLS